MKKSHAKIQTFFSLIFVAELLFATPAFSQEPDPQSILEFISESLARYNNGGDAAAINQALQENLVNQNLMDDPSQQGVYNVPHHRRLSSVARDCDAIAGDAWYRLDKKEVRIPGVLRPSKPPTSNLANNVFNRSNLLLTIEESMHFIQDSLPMDQVLALTPKYRDYLAATGLPFDGEAHVAAFVEENGRAC